MVQSLPTLLMQKLKDLFTKSKVGKETPPYRSNENILRISCDEKYPEILDWLDINTTGTVKVIPVNMISDTVSEVYLEFQKYDDILTFMIKYPDASNN